MTDFERTDYSGMTRELVIADKEIVVGSDVYDVFRPALENNEPAYAEWLAKQPGNEDKSQRDLDMASLNNQRAIMSMDLPGQRTMVLSRGHYFPAAIEVFGAIGQRMKAIYNVGHIWNIVPVVRDDNLYFAGVGICNGVLPEKNRSYDRQKNPPMFFMIDDDELWQVPDVSMLFGYGKTQQRKHPVVSAKGRLLAADNTYPDWQSLTVEDGVATMKFPHDEDKIFGVCIDDFLENPDGLITDPMFDFKDD